MDENQAATYFKALGDPTRLSIVNCLRSCCCPISLDDTGDMRPVSGQTVGEVCCRVTSLEKITSTVSFHLKELRQAGLIRMEKRGRNMLCSIDREVLTMLSQYLGAAETTCECCGGDCKCDEGCCQPA
jgi:ArsR family transcriptional regulator